MDAGLPDDAVSLGARNLLVNCAGLSAGDEILIIHEDPSLGWHDMAAPQAVAREAEKLGIQPRFLMVGAPGNMPDPIVEAAMEAASHVLFFARIGDQDRFGTSDPARRKVMSYARHAGVLASPFGTTDHHAMLRLKSAVNDALRSAMHIRITCPLGTDIAGAVPAPDPDGPKDVTMQRFPAGVPMPVGAEHFDGKVMLARYLTPTGSKVYDPAWLEITQPVTARIERGRILRFEGRPQDTAAIQSHYTAVSRQFDLDPGVVHSWHAGIHPGCAYDADAGDDPDHWSNSVFQNPRILHFHTCGAYPPGEICWMVLDPTVELDGVALWKDGALTPDAFPAIRAAIDASSQLQALFAAPSRAVGV